MKKIIKTVILVAEEQATYTITRKKDQLDDTLIVGNDTDEIIEVNSSNSTILAGKDDLVNNLKFNINKIEVA
ncbi:hypothetical protein [Sulfurimonas sp.]|uniref:hypothetical protein n=1 Tax=Sulfurimonas sp. TaxID=2022749 RepID=UPI002B4A1B13|nr:hypothetical protein [Sulfurimonas sp.]